ncbi:serine/threonine-protein kinase [Streptosporangium sp. NPDC051023]|uniref:serine/threonine-protein kinase n=1 Tax=Streptosporangium sp. NPDC051023 TaxID=3155410 RepID=UPI00344F0208
MADAGGHVGRLGRVGSYTLVERLGRGGMGEVYRATNKRSESVALKMLHDIVDADSEARIRLEREVRALRRVESPYVARVVDADLACERPYLVMEYIEGDTLLDRVRRGGPLMGAALVTLAHGLATALSIVHAAGVVHRDLKPANVLINAEDDPVLIDFGIAQVLDATRLTLTGTFLGTPSYAAPEVFADEPVGEPADVHAWAATVAFAATGRPTFGRGPAEAQMYAILNGQADLAGIPAALLPLVRAALHREAAKRPTAALLAARLSRLARAAISDAEPRKITRQAAATAVPDAIGQGAVKKPETRGRSGPPGARAEEFPRGGRPGVKAEEFPRGGRPGTKVAESVRPVRRVVRRRGGEGAGEDAAAGGGPRPLRAGSAVLVLLLAVLAVPCVVATVIWPVATFAVTGVFAALARAIWAGRWLVRKRKTARSRGVLRVVTFPPALAVSVLTVLAWPGLPAAALAWVTLWLACGGSLPPEWWLQPVPVIVAGIVFGVVCGVIVSREVERVSSRMPELRKEGLRTLAVLGGFVALCAAAVRAIALLV